MIDWNHILVTAAGVVATISAIRVDIKWLKRWTHDHARSDREAFSKVEKRLVEIERRL